MFSNFINHIALRTTSEISINNFVLTLGYTSCFKTVFYSCIKRHFVHISGASSVFCFNITFMFNCLNKLMSTSSCYG